MSSVTAPRAAASLPQSSRKAPSPGEAHWATKQPLCEKAAAGREFAYPRNNTNAATAMTTQTKPHDRLTAAERHELPDSASPKRANSRSSTPSTSVRRKPISAMHPKRRKPHWRGAYSPKPPNSACTYKALPSSAGLKNPDPHGRSSSRASPLHRQSAGTPLPRLRTAEAAAGVFLPPLHATIIPGTGTRLHLPGSGTFGHVPAGSPSSRPREAKGAGLPCTVIFRRS